MLILQDFRIALRMLRKTPGFTAVAVVCLALGIGANSTVFSLVDGMWTRPLPVAKPGELVYLFLATDRDAFGDLSYPEYEDIRDHTKTLAGLTVTQRRGPTLTGDGFAESTMSNVVSEDYFTALGVSAQLGRVFTARYKESGPVVVMSHNLWQRRFGGDPGIVGKTVRLGRAYSVIGIAPRGFRGVEPWIDSDFWIPMSSWDSSPEGEAAQRGWHSFAAIGRLRPGVSLEQARAEFDGLARNLERAYPKSNKGRRGVLYSALEYRIRSGGYTAGILMAVVALVLLIACANVAGLLLARAGVRSREIGIRVAVGAGRPRLVRQLLTESAILAVLGAAAGLLLAHSIIQFLPAVLVPASDTHTHLDFRMDSRVLAFTLVVSMATVLVFGLFPALRASRPDVASVLKGGPDQKPSARSIRPRSLLVIAQVAVSMILLTAAGLLVRTFMNSLHADLGFQRKDLLIADIAPRGNRARMREFYRQMLERVRTLPGVRQATLAMRPPLWGSEGGTAQAVEIPAHPLAPGGTNPPLKFNVVDHDYFRTMGIPLLRGRDFDEHDSPDAPKVMIISETMARRFWPDEDPVGKFVHARNDPDSVNRQIVGVARDARINSIQEVAEPYFYLPYDQSNQETILLLAETTGDPLRLANQLRAEVAALDKRVPVLTISTLGLVIRSSVYEQQITATFVGILGAIGLFLAAIGLYGVIAYAIVQRTREIGIRMALGAQRRDALRLVLSEGVRFALTGIVVGVAGAIVATPLMAKMLYGVGPRDPVTFACVAVLMVAVALAASYFPARRATKVDPLIALRYE
jgi:putative ABC transport system permease protein